ncbi:MAG: hypothetical protein IJA15_00750, partial [Clostridia bacterium]|nr:hypothetical protein [Clostridia bacterium]
YGYFSDHVLEEDACINCDLTAAVKLEIDGSVNYYQYFEDALEDADNEDEPTTITLLQDVDSYTLDVDGGIITIDLAGNKLIMDCLYVYEGTVIFTDSKRSNKENLDLELYIYNGEVIFDYVVADNLYVIAELYDDDSMAVTFNEVEIWYLYIGVYGSTNYSIDINGGTYGYINLSLNELGDVTILSAIVEEQIEVSDEEDNYFITDLFDSNCVTLKNEYGKPFTLDEDVSCYDGYIEFAKHSTCEAKEEYFADNKNHWLECECGSIVGEKQAHTGGEATCVSLAVCEVCEEEYGDYSHHLFDNRGVCSVCKQITYVYAKVVALGEEIFFGNIEDALDYAQTVESATVTLLEDAYGNYLPLYSGNITLDLNGYDLEVEELSLYGANLTVKDSLNSKYNYVEFEFTTDIYSGTLVIEGGNFANDICYFDLDPEGDSASLIIKGGNFMGVDIDTDSAGDLTVIIEGGRFVDACYFDIDDELNIMLRGGIFEKGISIGNDGYESYDLLSLISNVECVLATDKAGEEVTFINSVLYPGYLKLSHTQTVVGDYDGSHHWNKCACGEVLSEKQEHSYTDACDATCNECSAIREVPNHVYDNACDTTCNVCSAEREVPNHVYDNNCDRDCNVCNGERSIEHVYDNACDTTCNECGEERSVENHIWKETITVKAATTKENGKGIIECAVCGEKHEIVIPAKGGMSAGGIVATSVGGTLAVNAGVFSIIWFAVKKKKFKDLFTK